MEEKSSINQREKKKGEACSLSGSCLRAKGNGPDLGVLTPPLGNHQKKVVRLAKGGGGTGSDRR